MSEIGRPENYPFTITLVRVIGETWEDYIERCQDIANYVSGKHPKLPDEIRLINLDNFTPVSETAYEIITPGYAPQEEAGNERDTHFQGFAKLLWEEMLSQTQWQGIDVTADHIPLHHPEDDEHKRYIDLIARRAYDLACHTLYETSYGLDRFYISERINENVPDLTEWPE